MALLARFLRMEGRCPMPLNGDIPDYVFEFCDARHIGLQTVQHFRLTGGAQIFDGKRMDAINIPYIHEGKIVGWKYRAVKEKRFTQKASANPTLYNADCIPDCIANGGKLYWVEGEPDAWAMHEAGFRHVVSLRDGAQGYNCLETHKDILPKVSQHILAGDMDAAGLKWREDLGGFLRHDKCMIVEWPDGCKDAGDTLKQCDDRIEAIKRCVAIAKPWPIDGIEEIPDHDTIEAWWREPPPLLMTTGCSATDAVLHLPADGKLVVVTGFAGDGKSSWTKFVVIHTAMRHNQRWLVFPGEETPREYWTTAIEIYANRYWAHTTAEERRDARDFLFSRVRVLKYDIENHPPTIDWLIARTRLSRLTHGTTGVLIDPWNSMEHSRESRQTQTEYIGHSLQRLRHLAEETKCNVWINAHPQKLSPEYRKRPPNGYDIADSMHFAGRPDLGITIWRPDADKHKTEVHVWKSRSRRYGQAGKHADLDFDLATGRYLDPIRTPDPPSDPPPNNRWNGFDC